MTLVSDMAVLVILLWLASGVVTYGISRAHFTHKYGEDGLDSVGVLLLYVIATTGPIGTVMAYFLSGRARHGLRLR